MSDSDYLTLCSSYEADSEISISSSSSYSETESELEDNVIECHESKETKKLEKKKSIVLLEGYVGDHGDDLKRTKSLTDDDLEELKGCVDLGFGFNYKEIPELCNTLPALELCYSMTHNSNDQDHHHNWKISSPGDDPDDVKARLKFWAQAVACTVRLCT